MPIDWFTVGAQAVNFLILVWLLKRFLYKPILQAIDEREKGIAAQLARAEAKYGDAQKERDEFSLKSVAFDNERAAILKKAVDESKVERQRLIDEARQDADSARAQYQDALRIEKRNLSQEITRRAQKEVFAIARKTLANLATTALEERMTEVFIQRLCGLTGAAKEQLAGALKRSAQPACVRSAFDLPPAQRSAIEGAVKETFATAIQFRFEIAPDLVSGIELTVNGQKVAWSIADYLGTLEKCAGELPLEDGKPEAHSQPRPDVETSSVPNTEIKPEPRREQKKGLSVAAPKVAH